MAAYSCLLGNTFPWLAAIGSLLDFAPSPGCVYLTVFLTSSALILCPLIVSCLKPCPYKPTCGGESDKIISTEEDVVCESCVSDKVISSELKMLQNDQDNRYLVMSSSEALLSDSENLDQTSSSEDSEIDSSFRENVSHSTSYSDGSISDEESLIEIELPTGHYVDSKRTQGQSWYGFQQKWQDCSLESHFKQQQQNWMEILNEMNDENFIEIDICMGSIKCSRFEIEA
ncbi:uncharacterized protein LOC130806140 [Amaranthus tricolor]|uniref:uncharacterized protein LOC130806140 n=1 Tax=Amaranthus tricolor TaxID=29722 RepID=UPI00258CA738|nr:uncharacterized protein LOC130806140 [Amaranthus tricolor]